MSRLINVVMRVTLWGGLGAVIGVVGVLVAQNFFEGGVLGSGQNSAAVASGGVIGACIGGVIGFFRRN